MRGFAHSAQRKSPAFAGLFHDTLYRTRLRTRILDLHLRATVASTAFLRRVGVDRLRFAEALHRGDAAGVDTMRGQVVVHDLRATLRQLLVVRVGTDRVGVAVEFNLDLRITLQRVDGLVEDRDRVRRRQLQRRFDVVLTGLRTIELEVHAAEVDDDLLRAAVRTDDGTGSRIRAAVVAVVDAIVIVVERMAIRRGRRSSRRRRRRRRSRTTTEAVHETDARDAVGEARLALREANAARRVRAEITHRLGEVVLGVVVVVVTRREFAAERETLGQVPLDAGADGGHRVPAVVVVAERFDLGARVRGMTQRAEADHDVRTPLRALIAEEPATAHAETEALPLVAITPRTAGEIAIVDRVFEIDREVGVDPHACTDATPNRGVGVAVAIREIRTDARSDVPVAEI